MNQLFGDLGFRVPGLGFGAYATAGQVPLDPMLRALTRKFDSVRGLQGLPCDDVQAGT